MKKLIIIALIVISGFVSAPVVNAQYPEQPGIYRGHRRGWDRQYVTRYEQRYVRSRGRVYREVYRCTYTRSGRLINRYFIRRERLSRYNDRDNGLTFNVFLRF
jgi:hypothetical protein